MQLHTSLEKSIFNQAFVRNQSYESLLSCCLLNIFQLRPKWAVSPLTASPSQWRAESSRHNGKNCFSPFLTWYLWILYLCICLFVYLCISVFVCLYSCACICISIFCTSPPVTVSRKPKVLSTRARTAFPLSTHVIFADVKIPVNRLSPLQVSS